MRTHRNNETGRTCEAFQITSEAIRRAIAGDRGDWPGFVASIAWIKTKAKVVGFSVLGNGFFWPEEARVGDWLVSTHSGGQYLYTGHQFSNEFTPLCQG